MKEKKLKVAFYCRVGNPADIGMAVRRIPNHDDSCEVITFAGQKAMEEVLGSVEPYLSCEL